MWLSWDVNFHRYIAPEQVPVQYGGLSKVGESEFSIADAVTEETLKPACKHTIELPITEVISPCFSSYLQALACFQRFAFTCAVETYTENPTFQIMFSFIWKSTFGCGHVAIRHIDISVLHAISSVYEVLFFAYGYRKRAILQAGSLAWEVRVVGWDVSYGAEFVPSAEGGYTWIIQKARKIGSADELAISCTFKIGEPGKIVLTFDNQTSKKKKLLYRSKAL